MTLDYTDPRVRECLLAGKTGKIGLERETLRVDENGRLAQTPHPFGDSEAFTRDFCENQVEIVTPPSDSPQEAAALLYRYHLKAAERLLSLGSGREYLWPFSNPPAISGDDEIPIAQFHGSSGFKTSYREYLARKYGKRKMLFCGIHLNYSFDEELLRAAFSQSGGLSWREYRNHVYLSLAKRLAAYGWLITYLTAASPVSEPSFFTEPSHAARYSSARCGALGYWNQFVPTFDYSSLDGYTESILRYIRNEQIVSPSELYYPIRLKPKGENRLDHLRENGVNHIELRMLDVNPLTPAGIFIEDIAFIQFFILYLTSLPDKEFDEAAQISAAENFKNAALYDVDGESVSITTPTGEVPIRQEALRILEDMAAFYTGMKADKAVSGVLSFQKSKLTDRHNSYAFRVRERYGGDYTAKGLALARRYAQTEGAD